MNIALISDSKTEYKREGCEITFIPSDRGTAPEEWCRFDAAFLVAPVSENAVKAWTGHPHIRYVNNIKELKAEIDFLFKNIECEKKFLIKAPDFEALKKYSPFKADIEQVYLTDEDCSRRIRKRKMENAVSFVETVKIRLSPTVSSEFERRIDEKAYCELLKKANPKKHPIIKSRYCFFYKKQYFELDVFDFLKGFALLEIELKNENDKYSLPPEIEVIRDVTEDGRYKNSHLAGIAYEDYKTELL